MDAAKTNLPVQQALQQAARHLGAGRFRQCEHLVRQVLRDRPDNHRALHMLGVVALNAGHVDDAIKILRRAVEIHGTDAEYHRILGIALVTANRAEEGESALRRALDLRPADAMANFNMGQCDLRAGRFEEARRRIEKAARKMPGEAAVQLALGVAFAKCGEPARAVQQFRFVLKSQPANAEAQFNLACALTEAGKAGEAVPIFERLIGAHPAQARLHFNLGVALQALGRGGDAMAQYERAVELEPRLADAHVNLSVEHAIRGNHEAALRHIRAVRQLRPADTTAMINEASALRQAGRLGEALEVCRQAASSGPDDAEACGMEIMVLQDLGRFDVARDTAATFLAGQPGAVPVLYALSLDRDYVFSDDEASRLEEAAADKATERYAATRAWFALGNIHRDRGAAAASFRCYKRGNDLRDAEFAWTEADEQARFDGLIDVFSADFFRSRKDGGSASERPVFIVGMPRSGTTLVEQILSAHPDVEGGGELPAIGTLAESLPSRTGSGLPYPGCARDLTPALARQLAEDYLGRLAELSDSALRVTDKMPDNYQHLGLIAALLPKARVVFCRRDAMATCFSIYQQLFAGHHPYAYDLKKLGRRFRNHERLLEHWRRVLPLPMLEITYEDLVRDQEGQSRRLLEFCGLAWDPRVLDFHTVTRGVRTVSRWQVRQPIYTGAVQGWRAYEAFLGPLRESLDRA